MPASPLLDRLSRQLQQREQAGTRRRLPAPPAAPLVDFASNDYLGLSRHPALRAAVQRAAAQAATLGSTGARLLTGNSAAAEALEAQLAAFHAAEAALLFTSGYAANHGLLSALPQRGDVILYDEASHASVKEGLRGSFATAYSFRHNDAGHLRQRLGRLALPEGAAVFVAVEAVYSMSGDAAPLPELADVCRESGAQLIVDEAHSLGVYGPGGAGLVAELGLEAAVLARVVTFGKALGSQGAAVIGPQLLRDYLLNFSRPFIYTTAAPDYALAALRAGYEVLPTLDAERQRLQQLSAYLHRQLAEVPGARVPAGSRVIVPVQLPGYAAAQVRAAAAAVQRAGFDVRAIVPPTVPAGQQCLRVIVHSFNTESEIHDLVSALRTALA
ncbi:aminotransferase class I/II-fold pyridoxal phosphate-dependent enzyme [Hymenobacter gummosus]|uniref:Aminotransferase class I/II-fold pyridoxal phosphate-dependent enzyme n=1 Tax=Hymenobacter gummosus TaxID=1776032 RepID=A0A3S0JDD7_9BACT|nr:aminotransferase class I/II-fold pyridoxal phosphate-dependent enzyme [Hymenobacter gummosus]RTQ48908.1 aminotransferase class I/II-fold pyridoxal phosphate-dependent enzyme [Hymenobacter gummosus]